MLFKAYKQSEISYLYFIEVGKVEENRMFEYIEIYSSSEHTLMKSISWSIDVFSC